MNALSRFADRIGKDERLDRLADGLAANMDRVLAGVSHPEKVLDALHGKWLGHPLHPVLTDVPIGAWTFAGALDAVAMLSRGRSRAAPAAIGFGMVAAVPTALAGLTDWRATDGAARRVGTAHSLLNSGALGLYTLSLLLRGSSPALARLAGFGGLGLVGLSGYLGGHLVSTMRVGVKHEAEPLETPVFSEATIGEGLAEDKPKQIDVDGAPLMVVRHGGRLYALSDVCPHLGCSLSEGSISGDTIICPCHGSAFALVDGSVVRGPSVFPVPTYHAWAVDDDATPGPILDAGTE